MNHLINHPTNHTDWNRRKLIKSLVGIGLFSVAGASSLFCSVANAARPDLAFGAEDMDATMKALFESAEVVASDAITIKAPDIAENGAVVPISIKTDMANVESIALLVKENPAPMAAAFDVSKAGVADVSTRIKMGKTSDVIALVKADGKIHMASKLVKVTIGGCGG
ncbi:MAG: thiosulfate oxidation carrier protein SoxY [Arenicellales bacterium WSBS_2016_MAG_OTU3]